MLKARTGLTIILALGLMPPVTALAQEITAWRSPTCGCCQLWAKRLEAAGMKVTLIESDDLATIKKKHGVAPQLESCHTAVVEGYTIEGHVPPREIARLLAERPDAIGLSVPGMPAGSPGMERNEPKPYDVVLMKRDGTTEVFARYP